MNMRKLLLTVIAAVCMSVMQLHAQQLLVGSYNIRYQNESDARNGNGWDRRMPVLCAQVNFEHPNIFGVQEALEPQLNDLLSQLPDYAYIGLGRDDGVHAGEHEAIFYDVSRMELLDHGDFWLSETPEKPGVGWDAACVRICTWGKFEDRKAFMEFFFFNLHMDHVGVVARREAAKLVVERIRLIAGDKPVILTGDFNVDQNDEIYQTFTRSGLLKDSYDHARYRFAENGTFNSYDPDLKTESRIDHVFVSPRFQVDRYGVLTNGYWIPTELSSEQLKASNAPQEISFSKYQRRLPSDHYPVFVHLNWATWQDRVVVAYVTAGKNDVPDPNVMTHINYAFGTVNETFNGVNIQDPDRLRMIVGLKQQNPKLKVLLSIGGWTAGRFSEMAATKETRDAFAQDCKRIVDEFGLDGIDMDWEYPSSSEAGISSSPDDIDNFTLLMKELRRVLGQDKLLTIATICTAKYIDFKNCLPYLDLVNVMSYDMSDPNKQHHAALYPSPISGYCTASEAVEAHLKAGVPKDKLVMGMPFYGKGRRQDKGVDEFLRTGVLPKGYTRQWSDEAKAEYIANKKGEFVWAYETVRSLTTKCQYILDNNLRGGMYWEYSADKTGEFSKVLSDMLLP